MKIDKGEWLRFWGYVLSISLNTGTPVEKMWSDQPIPESVLPPPRMGRHGMPKNRFKAIRAAMRFGPSDDASFDLDEWCFVQPMVDAFNTHMAEIINPRDWLLCCDESMCAWRGKQGKRDHTKIPKLSWVPRKPEPLGCELKTAGCALSGALLFIEICKGKETHSALEYFKGKASDGRMYGHTTATTLRLVKPWFSSERVVFGDSWFASVMTAEALAQKGLFFLGDVKTATKRFPSEALEQNTNPENGAWATFTSELKLGGDKTIPIFSVSHRRGEHVHNFVSTCGTTIKGGAHLAYFEDEEDRAYVSDEIAFELTRKAPKVINDRTLAQPCIDRHNRYRQFLLAIEKRMVTNSFDFRMGCTLFGILVTNCFFLHRYLNSELADFKEEMSKLSYRVMRNPHAPDPNAKPSPQTGRGSPPGSPDDHDRDHTLRQISLFDRENNIVKKHHQLRCVVCGKKTSWYCVGCTGGPHQMVPVCPCQTRGGGKGGKGTKTHDCERSHCRQGKKCARKKRQRTADEDILEGDTEDDDDDEEDEEEGEEKD